MRNQIVGLAMLVLASCGVVSDPEATGLAPSAAVAQQAISDDNGLDNNGLDHNGLDHNGFSANGLDHNGLDHNGLASIISGVSYPSAGRNAAFDAWFNTNPVHTASFMKYFVKCAFDPSTTVTYTGTAGTTYNWVGKLGVGPSFRTA